MPLQICWEEVCPEFCVEFVQPRTSGRKEDSSPSQSRLAFWYVVWPWNNENAEWISYSQSISHRVGRQTHWLCGIRDWAEVGGECRMGHPRRWMGKGWLSIQWGVKILGRLYSFQSPHPKWLQEQSIALCAHISFPGIRGGLSWESWEWEFQKPSLQASFLPCLQGWGDFPLNLFCPKVHQVVKNLLNCFGCTVKNWSS